MRPDVRSPCMTTPVRVAVTGAAGQIGYSLLFRIASGSMLGPDTPGRSCSCWRSRRRSARSRASKMELDDCAFPLLAEVVCTDDADVAFGDVDVALLVGAMPRKAGMERSRSAHRQRRDLQAAGRGAEQQRQEGRQDPRRRQPGEHQRPHRHAATRPDLDPGRFTAMTRLDHNRAVSQLAAEDRRARSTTSRR